MTSGKNRVVLLLSLLMFAQCELPPEFDIYKELGYSGTFSGELNGSIWSGHSKGRFTDLENRIIGCEVDSLDYRYAPTEIIVFRNIPTKPGTYRLSTSSTTTNDTVVNCYLFYGELDRLLGYYVTFDEDSSNVFDLKSYDSDTRILEFSFDVSLRASQRPPEHYNFPDTLRYSNLSGSVIIDVEEQ